ncbi:hypothetical protein [Paraburkholderia sp. BR10879]|uniref:hypothetical protein n=2 Tax=unclassified Paraburkholderia TaxID=2615204 RepID=UPI003979DD2D
MLHHDKAAANGTGVATPQPVGADGTAASTSQTPAEDSSTDTQMSTDSDSPPKMQYRFVGLDGSPISGLTYRVQSDSATVDCSTGEDGSSSAPTTFNTGAECSVSVKTDTGEYKQVACFTIPSADTTVTLMSPSMLLKTSTELHGGGDADVYKEPPPEAPAETGNLATHPAYADDASSTPAESDRPTADTSASPAANSAGSTVDPTNTTAPPLGSVAPAPSVSSLGTTTLTTGVGNTATNPKPNAVATSSKAAVSKTTSASKPESKPASPKGGSGKPPVTPNVATKRDAVGHPQAQPLETWADWAGHKINAAWHFIEDCMGVESNPVAGKGAIAPAKRAPRGADQGQSASVLDTAAIARKNSGLVEEQTTHTMPSPSTVVNLKQIADGTIKYGTKASKESKGQCYMFVKIALWKMDAIRFIREKNGKFEGAGGSYAKVAGAFLESPVRGRQEPKRYATLLRTSWHISQGGL